MKSPRIKIKNLETASGLPLFYSGKDLDFGPLPCLFYFALTAEESLTLDPFNQPVQFLHEMPIRVFSSSLPCHNSFEKHTEAMARWAKEMGEGNDILDEFLSQTSENIRFLIEQGIAKEGHIAAAGLSRGGFIATQLAKRCQPVSHILGFAPVTDLSALQEFKHLANSSELSSYLPSQTLPQLIHKKLRYYIGNQDTRTGTKNCFEFVYQLSTLATENKVRSPAAELIISPSIGHKGHGTPPEVFKDGIDWIAKEII